MFNDYVREGRRKKRAPGAPRDMLCFPWVWGLGFKRLTSGVWVQKKRGLRRSCFTTFFTTFFRGLKGPTQYQGLAVGGGGGGGPGTWGGLKVHGLRTTYHPTMISTTESSSRVLA